MFVSVHYADSVRNVKTNRGGITGHIYCLSHFLACTFLYTQILFLPLCNSYRFYIICVFYCTYCNCSLLHANEQINKQINTTK